MYQFRIAFLSTFLLALLKSGECYIVTVDARAEDCYHAKVDAGTKMGMYDKRRLTTTPLQYRQRWQMRIVNGQTSSIEY